MKDTDYEFKFDNALILVLLKDITAVMYYQF